MHFYVLSSQTTGNLKNVFAIFSQKMRSSLFFHPSVTGIFSIKLFINVHWKYLSFKFKVHKTVHLKKNNKLLLFILFFFFLKIDMDIWLTFWLNFIKIHVLKIHKKSLSFSDFFLLVWNLISLFYIKAYGLIKLFMLKKLEFTDKRLSYKKYPN